ncbi:MAG: pseudouridine synthase [Bacteroidia bacterium]
MLNSVTVLYEDEWLIAVDKPGGVVVHKTAGAPPGKPLLQQVRDHIGMHVFPVHRLDRGTSGVMLFGKSKEAASEAGKCFMNREVQKTYQALVRGWTDEAGLVDYPLTAGEKDERMREAQTHYTRLQTFELAQPIGRYDTARYSLLEVRPHTGRWRQIRRHFAHLRHPVIGDVQHGDRHHNHFFRGEWGIMTLCLSAVKLALIHPFTEEALIIQAQPGAAIREALERLR